MSQQKLMMSVREASAETGLAYTFLLNLCKEGKIKSVKSGKKYYINMESLRQYCS